MNLPINRHKCLIALANDIIADGVDIDVEDIERIIDIYERILITSSEQGCDNTKVLYGYIEPFARIDLVNINDEGLQSLRQFVMNLNTIPEEDEVFKKHIHALQPKTLDAIIDETNIAIVLRHVQDFMHFLGGLATQFIDDNKNNTVASFRFSSQAEQGIFSFTALMSAEGRIFFRYFNSTFISNMV